MKSFKKVITCIIAIMLLISVVSGCGAKQEQYPNKPIDLLTASSTGSGGDTLLRVIAQHLSKELGVNVNVLNESGGNGIPAVTTLRSRKPDGYTLFGDAGLSSSYQLLRNDVPYDVMDRTFICRVASGPQVLITSPQTGWKNLNDVAEAMKKDPQNFLWGGIGGMSAADFAQIEFMQAIGVDPAKTKKVIQQGGGAILTAVAGNHVLFGSAAASAVPSYTQSGKVIAIAVAGDKRLAILPDTMSAAEQGFPEITAGFWSGISAPVGLSADMIKTIDEAVQKIIKNEGFKADIEKLGVVVDYANAEQMRKDVLAEADITKTLIK